MTEYKGLSLPHQPDPDALVANLLRKGTPARVHHMELFHDYEIRTAIAERFGLMEDLNRDDDPVAYERWKTIRVNRFCGFDHVGTQIGGDWKTRHIRADDTADAAHPNGRYYQDEHTGPIMSWEDFESFPWPNPQESANLAELEWYAQHLPDDMCLAGHTGHFCELLCWLMGYETLCYMLYDDPKLVQAIADKVLAFHAAEVATYLQHPRVRLVWGSDDMGYKTGLMISADDMRKFVLPGHQALAKQAHAAGRVYLLHSCGKLHDIIDELIDDVGIDAKHSFEDTIEDVREAKKTYGRKAALIGGMDVDFLCRSTPDAIRRRVRDTLAVCQQGGGYCLGSGNSVANYIPLENYLAMIDEGRLWGR